MALPKIIPATSSLRSSLYSLVSLLYLVSWVSLHSENNTLWALHEV